MHDAILTHYNVVLYDEIKWNWYVINTFSVSTYNWMFVMQYVNTSRYLSKKYTMEFDQDARGHEYLASYKGNVYCYI